MQCVKCMKVANSLEKCVYGIISQLLTEIKLQTVGLRLHTVGQIQTECAGRIHADVGRKWLVFIF